MFYVLSEGLYHTGTTSRDIPPCAYLSDFNEAASWETQEAAQAWADKYGGSVREEIMTNPTYEQLKIIVSNLNKENASLKDIIKRASFQFFHNGPDGEAASKMLSILNEAN